MTELATLERKRLSDLHQIASQLGIEQYRKYRKNELAELIYKVATEQAAEQTPSAPTATAVAEPPPSENGIAAAEAPPEQPTIPQTSSDSNGSAATEAPERQPQPQQKQQKQDRKQKGSPEPRDGGGDGGNNKGETIQTGILDVLPDGFGFLRTKGYSQSKGDVYISTSQIKRFNLRRGDFIVGQIRPARDGEKYPAMVRIETVNGNEPQKGRRRIDFDDLTPLFPDERLRLEWKPNDLAPRVIDLVAPIGKGQRGLIVSPPKAGKTTILKQVAQSISANYPEVKLMVLLADERPEEVTDWQRSVEGAEVVASTFDQPAENHVAVAELLLERIKRLVEDGEDVVVVLDSITRLARAYNLAAPASGRILSGGVDSAALYPPKKFFGAARNIEFGGSLTILGSALVETGSRMDEVIYEEFKGTGNMEIHLERKLANRRIYPAINIEESSTRKEELLMETSEAQRVWQVRSILNALDSGQKIELLIQKLKETKTNAEFLRELQRVRG
ncbi:MAG: transcription termination factor Rho [Actinomycetota bacterium]|jgi:transcription termination factor Rho|nr:transcription termination factor Rho [Rubrobacter sp.]MDQ3507468.1 transcription termination factor Rho [Actinomycetota bacterium]